MHMSDTDSGTRIASATTTGRRRTNQDAAIALDLQGQDNIWGFAAIVGVADGMGGHAAGEVASRIAAETVGEFLCQGGSDARPDTTELSGGEATEALAEAVRLANLRIYQQAQADDSRRDMGTTLTLVGLTQDTAVVAHVGDCRGYLVNASGIHQITQDHSWVAKQVREARMTEEEAAHSPLRAQIMRTLGVEDDVEPDMLAIPLEPGTVFLVCSDGLTDVMGAVEIEETLKTTDTLRQGCDALIGKALERSAPDNVTVACVEFGRLQRGADTSAAQQQEMTHELYPSLRTRGQSADHFDMRRMRPVIIAAIAAVVIASALLLRSCLLAPVRQQPEDRQPQPQTESAVELPPLEEGLAVKVAVINGDLVAAANRHVQITIHPPGPFKDEPKAVIGPDGDYTRAITDHEAAKWADKSCTVKLSVKGEYVYVRTVPEDLELYLDNKLVKERRIRVSSLTGKPARVGFYFPANDKKSGYTVALTRIDPANLPAPSEDKAPGR